MTKILSVPVEIPEGLARSLGFDSDEKLAADFRTTLAVRLFEEGRVSLGRAASMGAMHKADFMDELGRRKVSIINWDEDEIRRELGYAREGIAVRHPLPPTNT